MSEEFFIKCECGTEGLYIEKDDEYNEICMAMWHTGKDYLSFAEKLRWIWNILKNKPYSDHFIISTSRVQELIDTLEHMK